MQLFKQTPDSEVIALCGEKAFDQYVEAIEKAHINRYGTARGKYAGQIFNGLSNLEPKGLPSFGDGTFDLGLMGLLAKDGASLKAYPREKWDRSLEDICSQFQRTGFCGFVIQRDLSMQLLQAGLNLLAEEILNPVLSKNLAKNLSDVEERRQTSGRMLLLGQQVAYYSIRQLMGQATPSVPQVSPLLADLMGMNAQGVVDFKTWSGDQSAFQSSAEALCLNMFRGKPTPPVKAEGTYFDHLHQMGQSLTFLPAQVLVLQGCDPRAVMETVRGKLEFMYTYRHGHNSYTTGLVESGSKAVFLPFPHLWKDLEIEARDFLGMAPGEIPENPMFFSKQDEMITGLGFPNYSGSTAASP
jgi:hypothetical protein